MASPYSIDLRQRVVKIYNQENMAQQELAERFKISTSSIKRYLRLDRETGDLLPKVNGRGNQGRPGKIADDGLLLIKKIVEKNPTITLEELADVFYKKKKIKVGRSILSRAVLKLKLRLKKLSRYAHERNRNDIKKNAKNTLKR